MANTNKIAQGIITERLEALCVEGHFPKIGFEKGQNFTKYMLHEWSPTYAKLATLVHSKLVDEGFQDGIFATRLRSNAYILAVKKAANGTTPEEIKAVQQRFRTWMD